MNLDAQVSKFTGDGGVVSKGEVERRIRDHVLADYKKHGFGRLAVELKSNHQFIGFCGLKFLEDLKDVDLGYRFMSEYWGQGYATEASKAVIHYGFNTLNLVKIIAMVLPANIASVNVLKKLDFKFENDIDEDGELVHVYSLIRG
jgi:RimJ/RimL family protein N-acetyltransferase